MTEPSFFPLLYAGVAAGLLHSLDADHLAAVAGLSSHKASTRNWFMTPLQWATGHGLALLGIASAVLLMGMAIPYAISEWAEQAVAFALLIIGTAAWVQLYNERRGRGGEPNRSKKAVAVGLLHGCAGSAPVLALLPAVSQQSPFHSLFYVLLFCVGVVFSMLLLGRLLALSFVGMQNKLTSLSLWLRPLFASFSIALGSYLIFSH